MTKSIDTKAFWNSMTMGLTAQQYVEQGLVTKRLLHETHLQINKRMLALQPNDSTKGAV